HIFAMLAFWTIRADATFDLIAAVSFLLGGGIAPVAFLPPFLAGIATYLPFYYMIGFPIEVATGAVAAAPAAWRGIAVTLAWSVAFFAVYRLLWRLGIRRYGAVGA